MEYRKEDKYLLSAIESVSIQERLKYLLHLDSNVFFDDCYSVRSIYFDSYDNSYFYANQNGVDSRFKIRIRIYNCNDCYIKLEIKYKEKGYTKKDFCLINKTLCNKLINGEYLDILDCKNNKVLNKVYLEQRMHRITPKIIVDYDRVAYVSDVGNLRITFDDNIKVSKYVRDFFDKNLSLMPLLENNMKIMEIKYNNLIPKYILDVMNLGNMNNVSFSKYCLSRLMFKEEIL